MINKYKRVIGYSLFFLALFLAFYTVISQFSNFTGSKLAIINNDVKDFSFTNQNGAVISSRNIEDKVYVVEYFFTTCRGICPKMNANMRLIYEKYKNEPDFLILSHTCMPEVDSTKQLKDYERWMINGNLKKNNDGSYTVEHPEDSTKAVTGNKNWYFLTGKKEELYKMARISYLIDKGETGKNEATGTDDFVHTQFFALVDRQRRVRKKIYDGLKMDEVQELISDIDKLLKEKTGIKN